MSAIFDDKGIITSGVDSIREEIFEDAKIRLAPYLDGKELLTDESSVIGRIGTSIAVPCAKNEEILPQILAAFDIEQAEGLQLDNFASIHRIFRKPPSQAEGFVIVYADLGTTINELSRVSSSRTGDIFSTNETITINNLNNNGIELSISAISQTYSITYSIHGYLSSSPVITVTTTANDTTISAVADRIVDAVTSQSSYLSATKNNDNTVRIEVIDKNKIADFSVTGDIEITRAYKPVYVTSDTYVSSEAAINTITKIGTPVTGWRGVTNPFAIEASKGVETDEEFRYRIKIIKGGANSGSYNSINYAVSSVKGVSFCNIKQNFSGNSFNGINVVVSGGSEDDIAIAIFRTNPMTPTVGDIEKEVKDVNGGSHIIRFSRPKVVPLEISMSLVVYPDFPTAGQTRIKQAIVDWFNNLKVGEDVYYSRLYEPINTIRGFSVRNLQIGKLGGTLNKEDVILASDEIATISAENINIGGG